MMRNRHLWEADHVRRKLNHHFAHQHFLEEASRHFTDRALLAFWVILFGFFVALWRMW